MVMYEKSNIMNLPRFFPQPALFSNHILSLPSSERRRRDVEERYNYEEFGS